MKVDKEKEVALLEVKVAATVKEQAQIIFEDKIVKARNAGCSLRQIEKVAGVSNVTVMNVSKRNKNRKRSVKDNTNAA